MYIFINKNVIKHKKGRKTNIKNRNKKTKNRRKGGAKDTKNLYPIEKSLKNGV